MKLEDKLRKGMFTTAALASTTLAGCGWFDNGPTGQGLPRPNIGPNRRIVVQEAARPAAQKPQVYTVTVSPDGRQVTIAAGDARASADALQNVHQKLEGNIVVDYNAATNRYTGILSNGDRQTLVEFPREDSVLSAAMADTLDQHCTAPATLYCEAFLTGKKQPGNDALEVSRIYLLTPFENVTTAAPVETEQPTPVFPDTLQLSGTVLHVDKESRKDLYVTMRIDEMSAEFPGFIPGQHYGFWTSKATQYAKGTDSKLKSKGCRDGGCGILVEVVRGKDDSYSASRVLQVND